MKSKVLTRKVLAVFAVLSFLFSSSQSRMVPDAVIGQTCELPNNAGASTCQSHRSCRSIGLLHLKNTNGLSEEDKLYMFSLSQQCQTRGRPLFCCPPDDVATTLNPLGIRLTNFDLSTIPDHPKPVNVEKIVNHANIGLINQKCGSSSTSRIIGGTKAKAGDYPWMALLQYNNEGDRAFKCGGTLISENYILTAAHCINKDLVAVRLGEHQISTKIDKTEDGKTSFTVQDIEIESSLAYQKYNKVKKVHDIGLIRLKSPANLEKPNIRTICLPVEKDNQLEAEEFDEDTRNNLVIAGWGKTENKTGSDVLMKATVSFIDKENCSRRLEPIEIFDTWLCAGGKTKTDTCQGDSGGPLFAPATINGRTKMIQYGVIAAGVGCEDARVNFPAIYTNVGNYIKWILDNMH